MIIVNLELLIKSTARKKSTISFYHEYMASRFLDESPRWLLQKNRSEETKQILVEVAKRNRWCLLKDVDVVLYQIIKVHIVITILHFNLKFKNIHRCTLHKQITGYTCTNKPVVVFVDFRANRRKTVYCLFIVLKKSFIKLLLKNDQVSC